MRPREFANEYLEILYDEKKVEPKLSISIETASDENTPEELQRQQVLVKMTGEFPEGAKEFLLYLDPSCPMAVVMVTIKDDRPSRRMQVILAGEYSRPVNIQPLVEGDPFTEPGKGELKATPTVEKREDASPTSTDQDTSEEKSAKKRSSIIEGWLAYFGFSLVPALLPAAILLLTLNARLVFGQIAALVIGRAPALPWLLLESSELLLGRLRLRVCCLQLSLAKRSFIANASGGDMLLPSSQDFSPAWSYPWLPDFLRFLLKASQFRLCACSDLFSVLEMGLVAAALVASGVLLFLSRFDWYRTSIVQPLTVLLQWIRHLSRD